MKQLLHRLLGSLATAALCLAASSAHAQLTVPFVSNEGVPKAMQIAQDSLGSDVRLISLLTIAGDVGGPTLATYDHKTGKADVWVYHFYSPSRRMQVHVGVVQVPFIGWQGNGTLVPVDSMQVGARDTIQLDTSGAYATSDKIFDRFKNDTAYVRHQQQYPGFDPQLATLASLNIDEIPELPGVDLLQPFWTVVWGGEGDSNMICIVGTKTGDAFCRRLQASSVPDAPVAGKKATVEVAPNPSNGSTRVSIAIPEGAQMSNVEVSLYNERGDRVLDLTESFTRNGYGYAEFDASSLPSGVYYCRAIGSNWSGFAGVVVEK